MLEPRRERGLVAEAPRQVEHLDARVCVGQGVEQSRRRVAARVIDDDQLERDAVERLAHTVVQRLDRRLLVVHRSDDADEARVALRCGFPREISGHLQR